MEQSDSQLIRSWQAGDECAFETLLERHQRAVLNFCYRLLGNAADADDVAQEAFVRLYQQCAQLDPDRPLPAWLFTVARRLCIDRHRHRHRHPTEPLATAPELVTRENVVQNRELEAAIAAAIAALPEEQRTAIVLAEYHGLAQAEIAEIMGGSVKAVETRIYRARRELRRRLASWME
jgi:RNA polymerase sigma-70 factor (ECF subfamily)